MCFRMTCLVISYCKSIIIFITYINYRIFDFINLSQQFVSLFVFLIQRALMLGPYIDILLNWQDHCSLISYLHMGHMMFFWIHWLMHSRWNTCFLLHLSSTTYSSISNSLKQMMHSFVISSYWSISGFELPM